MRHFARGMGQGALVGLVGLTLGAVKALLHGLKYRTPLPKLSDALVLAACMIAGFAIVGGVVEVCRRRRR